MALGAAQGVLDVAENRVHPTKLGALDRGFPAARHHRLMNAARFGNAVEAGQPIGDNPSADAEVLLRSGGDLSESEALDHGAVEGEELVEADAFLELHRAADHVKFLFLSGSYMAVFRTRYCLESRGVRCEDGCERRLALRRLRAVGEGVPD